MSGDTEIPPTYYFSGITFNPSFYQSSTSDYLTLSTAKKKFLTYPTAQGTETISNLITTSIETSTPTIAFNLLSTQTGNLNIANTTTGTTGQTIKIGASTLTSVQSGGIELKGAAINNSVASTYGDVSICDLQTTGSLNIGTGTRLTTGNGGAINIGGGLNAANPINIGSVNAIVSSSPINLNTSTAASGAVNIGSTSSTTNVKGNFTANGLTINSGYNLIANGSIACASYLSSTASTACYLASNVSSALITLGQAQTTGNIEIGNYTAFAGTVTIAGSLASGSNSIKLGNSLTTTTNGGALINTGLITANGGITIPSGKALTANGGIVASTIDTPTAGTMAIGASATNGITLGAGNASTSVAGGLTVSGQIYANAGLTVSNTLTTGVGTLSGSTAYELTSATTYTIPNTINRDYYLLVLLSSGTSVITMPTLKVNQIVHIRVYNTAGTAITVKVPTSTTGSFYPNGLNTSFALQWTAFPAGTTQNFYCTGSDWVGF